MQGEKSANSELFKDFFNTAEMEKKYSNRWDLFCHRSSDNQKVVLSPSQTAITRFSLMQQINDFFEIYAKALENYDSKGMAFLYNIPCTMLSDDATSVFNDAGKLEGFFNQGTGFYRQFGIANVRPQVWSWLHLTAKIVNVKVKWQYLDVFKKLIYECDYHYVLKADKNNQWKIILSVSVNEKERMEEWKAKSDKLKS